MGSSEHAGANSKDVWGGGCGLGGWGGGGVVRARAQSNPSLTQYFIFHEKFWISLINLGYSIYP